LYIYIRYISNYASSQVLQASFILSEQKAYGFYDLVFIGSATYFLKKNRTRPAHHRAHIRRINLFCGTVQLMKEILFVCTGNIFRSMIAEKALRHVAGLYSPYRFASAGTEATAQKMAPLVQDGLLARGIDPTGHQQRKLTPQLFHAADLVIAIGLDHAAFIQEHYNAKVALFNEVAHGRREAILDTWEAVPDHEQNAAARNQHIQQVIAHICDSAPQFLRGLPSFIK